jgi:hypothetical protein
VLSESLPPSIFFIISERDEEVVAERGDLCEVSLGRRMAPSRIGGDAHPTRTYTYSYTYRHGYRGVGGWMRGHNAIQAIYNL